MTAPDLAAVNFADLRFMPDPGITGFEMAMLADSPQGSVRFWRIPSGWNIGQLGVRENLHVHRSVFEYAAVLSGRLPHIEYDLETRQRHRIEFTPGQLMIRPNGSIHGLDDSLTVQDTCTILYWNTGPGTSMLDHDYAVETADVLDDCLDGRVVHHGVCRIIDALAQARSGEGLRWQYHSLAGEPQQVSVGRLAAGETLAADELLGEGSLFAFLWQGRCELVEAAGQASRSLEQWSLLSGDSAVALRGRHVRAQQDAVWLRVRRDGMPAAGEVAQ